MFNISVALIYCGVDKEIEMSISGMLKESELKKNFIGYLDTNAHSEKWGSILKKRRWKGKTRGEELINLLDENNLYVCNKVLYPPTFVRDSSVHDSSHVDITVCSSQLYNSIQNWKVSDESFSSDHCAIMFQVSYNKQAEGNKNVTVQIPWRKPKEKMKEVMREVLSGASKKLGWVNKIQQIDTVISVHSEQIRKLLEGIFIKKDMHKGSRLHWWNEEVNKIYLEMRKARRRMKKYKYVNLKEEFNIKRKEFRKVVRIVKMEAWRKFTTEIKDPWDKLIKIIKATMSGKIQSRTLTDLDGNFADDMSKTLHLLGRQFFPPLDILSDEHKRIEEEVEVKLREVEKGPELTICEFRKALSEMSTSTAPGLDQITNNVINILAVKGKLEYKYLKLFNTCLKNAYFPKIWKKARIVLIPKPSPLVNSAKSFMPISLTSSFAKLFERMILARLLHYLSLSDKMHENQHAYKKGSSTQTALYEVFNVVQSAMTKKGGGLCVVVFLDISGAFDCTWHYGILYKLFMYGVLKYLVAWIKSFLMGRITYFNESNEEYDVELQQGCPQGGVLSPILWNVLFNEMFGLPINKGKGKQDCMKVIGYADDAVIVCKTNIIQQAEVLLNEHLEKIRKWSLENRVKFNPAKFAVLSISNKIGRPQLISIFYDKVPVLALLTTTARFWQKMSARDEEMRKL